MSFTAQKATDLKTSSDSLDVIIGSNDTDIAAFAAMLATNAPGKTFYYVAEKGEADVDDYCAYKELGWCFLAGPLPGGAQAGKHFVIREFKAKDADYGVDESAYVDLSACRVVDATLENKALAASKFDLFLDDFKTFIDGEISTYS